MLPVSSLLNPTNSEPRNFVQEKPTPLEPTSMKWTRPLDCGIPLIPFTAIITKQKMSKDGAIFSKGKIKGEVKYPPFESFDDKTLKEIQKFKVYPVGQIQSFPRHIPYNSEKKNFLEKTGRESFEVFQYVFTIPGKEKVYTVMWDYNVGLVRITPFFRCCEYSKTQPARMLQMNPGLKDITHSITGGALAAQGYWMPYNCAFAICATFCHKISPALMPIFGPNFPDHCTAPTSPDFPRMVISPSIIKEAKEEAEAFRRHYSSATARSSFPSPSPTIAGSPDLRSLPQQRIIPVTYSSRRLKRTRPDDGFNSDSSSPDMRSSDYFKSPITPPPAAIAGHQWNALHAPLVRTIPRSTPMNGFNVGPPTHRQTLSCGPSPWLTALPRLHNMPPRVESRFPHWVDQRRDAGDDDGYDGGESENDGNKLSPAGGTGSESTYTHDTIRKDTKTCTEDIKNAALGLISLCAYDPVRASPRTSPLAAFKAAGLSAALRNDDEEIDKGPPKKKLRATSI